MSTSSSTSSRICRCGRWQYPSDPAPRVLLYLFGSKDELIRALLARARVDELQLLARIHDSQPEDTAGLDVTAKRIWSWLAAEDHRARLTLRVEGYARSMINPRGPWGSFAKETVGD